MVWLEQLDWTRELAEGLRETVRLFARSPVQGGKRLWLEQVEWTRELAEGLRESVRLFACSPVFRGKNAVAGGISQIRSRSQLCLGVCEQANTETR